jgi:hypothetical protein
MLQTGQSPLLELALALGTSRRLSGRLNRRQQQRDQDADNGDHYQQFD